MKIARSIYTAALYLYPRDFRSRFGREMVQTFDISYRRAPNKLLFILRTAWDILISCIEQRNIMTAQFLRRELIAPLVLLVALVLSSTVVRGYVISGPSMEPSLRIGDYALVNKLHGSFQRGELVVFNSPENPSQVLVKRVIGLPGDRIRMQNKEVFRNGTALQEAYAYHATSFMDEYRDNFPTEPLVRLSRSGQQMLANNVSGGEVIVPTGALFVLGDNRDKSLDSRFFGFVAERDVIGHPWVVYWSRDVQSKAMRWDRMPMLLRD